MEKLGIEQAKAPSARPRVTRKKKLTNDSLEKNATSQPVQREQIECDHPENRLIRSEGVVYCRKCEKYLQLFP